MDQKQGFLNLLKYLATKEFILHNFSPMGNVGGGGEV